MSSETAFNPKTFIDRQVKEIKDVLGNNKAIIACSGGVDSTTCGVLTHRAVGDNLICIFVDTGFMRLGEPEAVFKALKEEPFNLPIKLVRATDKFLKNMKGIKDAEDKRKAFRDTFYTTLSEVAKTEKCQILVQGTILPDIIETTKGIKTQHNVLEQMNINPVRVYRFKVVEPLASLYKFQVREVAKALGMPLEASMRQPFPGPGLSVRVVGEITADKLDVEKKATQIIEAQIDLNMSKQYFAAIIDDAKIAYPKASEVEKKILTLLRDRTAIIRIQSLRDKATGIKKGERQYGGIVLVDIMTEDGKCLKLPYEMLNEIQKTIIGADDGISRVLYRITDSNRNGKGIISIRAVDTLDFMTATVSAIPWKTLTETGKMIMDSCPTVSTAYYDVTPKPPSSIEFE